MRERFTGDELTRLKSAFFHLKAEFDPFFGEHLKSMFVHTDVYDSAQIRGKCLLVGRKGSGKTALLLGHKKNNSNSYYVNEDISLDDMPFEQMFNFFFTDFLSTKEKLIRDTKKTFDATEFIEIEKVAYYAWKNSIITVSILHSAVIILKNKSQLNLTDKQRVQLEKTVRNTGRLTGLELEDLLLGKTKLIIFPFLIYFFRHIQDAIEEAIGIDVPSLSVLLATVTQKILHTLEKDLDTDLRKSSIVIRDVLSPHDQKMLLTLDKFDDFYDKFYKDHGVSKKDKRSKTPDFISNRKEFLRILLEGLILATRDVKKYSELDWLDTLFTIPMDKYLELHLRERMDLENEHLLFIDWTPLELFEFVNRRISKALFPNEGEVKDAWYEVFPKFVTNSRTNIPEDSFLYLVRHSLWKPREVQKYVLELINLMEEKEGRPLVSKEISSVVAETSIDIVRTEFIEEFLREYPGIHKLLQKLEHAYTPSVMPYSVFVGLISDVELSETDNNIDRTMERLFKMGLIGIKKYRPQQVEGKQPTVMQGRRHVHFCFHYNTLLTDPFSENDHIIIHPLFYDRLGVDQKEQHIMNELRWDMYKDKDNM